MYYSSDWISSFRPFEINVSKDTPCGFTRGAKKCTDYELFIAQLPTFEASNVEIIVHRDKLFQFFNHWMLEAQRNIERKKCIRSIIQALSDSSPLIYEDLPEILLPRKNKTQISLPNALLASQTLQKIQGTPSTGVSEEMQKIQPLVGAAHKALIIPLDEQKGKLDKAAQDIVDLFK